MRNGMLINYGRSRDDLVEVRSYHPAGDRYMQFLERYMNSEEDEIAKYCKNDIASVQKVHDDLYENFDSQPLEKYTSLLKIDMQNKLLERVASNYMKIKNVIFSGPCTIVLWEDGTKTIVRCDNEDFDKEKGLAMAIAKKALGNTSKYYDTFKKYIKEEK